MDIVRSDRAAATIPRWKGPVGFFGLSSAVSGLLVSSAWTLDSPLGVPGFWTWLLTGLQVLALWGAGSKRWWGWLLGAAVQPPWIAYALLTGQLGFIPGCVVSAAVQIRSSLRGRPTPRYQGCKIRLGPRKVAAAPVSLGRPLVTAERAGA
jgi:hypothetical protein